MTDNELHVGEEVEFLDSNEGGKVVKIDIDRKMATIAIEEGFEVEMPIGKCVPLTHHCGADAYIRPVYRPSQPTPKIEEKPAKPTADEIQRKKNEQHFQESLAALKERFGK